MDFDRSFYNCLFLLSLSTLCIHIYGKLVLLHVVSRRWEVVGVTVKSVQWKKPFPLRFMPSIQYFMNDRKERSTVSIYDFTALMVWTYSYRFYRKHSWLKKGDCIEARYDSKSNRTILFDVPVVRNCLTGCVFLLVIVPMLYSSFSRFEFEAIQYFLAGAVSLGAAIFWIGHFTIKVGRKDLVY